MNVMPPVTQQSYADLHQHLDRLDQAGLLVRIAEPINKDTEMHPPGWSAWNVTRRSLT